MHGMDSAGLERKRTKRQRATAEKLLDVTSRSKSMVDGWDVPLVNRGCIAVIRCVVCQKGLSIVGAYL